MDSFTLDLKFESSSSSRARVVFFLQELARLPSPACRLPPAGARVIPFVQALGPRLQALAPFVQALGPDLRCPVRPPLRPLGCCRARPAWPPLCPLGSHPRPAWSSPRPAHLARPRRRSMLLPGRFSSPLPLHNNRTQINSCVQSYKSILLYSRSQTNFTIFCTVSLVGNLTNQFFCNP